ncbi:24551_t:CDS:2, partial [Cetraspora pellucida]
SLAYHQKHCSGLGEATQEVKLPIKDVNDLEKLKNYSRMINALCVIIADFEADNKKCDEKYGGQIGENAIQEFVKRIDKELVQINRVLAIKHDRIKTEEDKKKFTKTNTCWICKDKFNRDNKDKVWDYCHITDKFRGPAHNACNLKLQIESWKTPISVVFHNFQGYDSHLVCKSVGKSVNAYQIKVIAETFEHYKSMKVGQHKYINNMQFMNNSLANLMKNLGSNHSITSQHFKDYSSDQISLASCKGVYSYDYIDSQERFKKTELPPIHEFYSILKGKISQDDYYHAQKVWKTFGCKTLEKYHNLYLKIDVLSLADIWTQFQMTCMQYYELDPSHYVSAPALAWNAMLKMTGVKIELFTDMSMYDFIEDAKHGGIAIACKRYFKANNPKIDKKFDPSKPTT